MDSQDKNKDQSVSQLSTSPPAAHSNSSAVAFISFVKQRILNFGLVFPLMTYRVAFFISELNISNAYATLYLTSQTDPLNVFMNFISNFHRNAPISKNAKLCFKYIGSYLE